MIVTVDLTSDFVAGSAELLFDASPYRVARRVDFEVARDGERFLMLKRTMSAERDASQTEVVLVQDWFSELERLVPTQ